MLLVQRCWVPCSADLASTTAAAAFQPAGCCAAPAAGNTQPAKTSCYDNLSQTTATCQVACTLMAVPTFCTILSCHTRLWYCWYFGNSTPTMHTHSCPLLAHVALEVSRVAHVARLDAVYPAERSWPALQLQQLSKPWWLLCHHTSLEYAASKDKISAQEQQPARWPAPSWQRQPLAPS
jgi:hypothetical protein